MSTLSVSQLATGTNIGSKMFTFIWSSILSFVAQFHVFESLAPFFDFYLQISQ